MKSHNTGDKKKVKYNTQTGLLLNAENMLHRNAQLSLHCSYIAWDVVWKLSAVHCFFFFKNEV